AVALLEAVAQRKRLGELVAGLQVEDSDAGLDLGEHVDEATPLSPEGSRHGKLGMKLRHRPAQDVLWRRCCQEPVRGRDSMCGKRSGEPGTLGEVVPHRNSSKAGECE